MFLHTISYVAISYVKTYDIVLRYGIIENTMLYHLMYDVATYDIVCITYDVVCNIRCRMFHIRCRILQSYATSYVVGNTLYVLVFISHAISHTISYTIFLLIWSGESEIPIWICFQVHIILPVLLQQCYSTTDPHPPAQAPLSPPAPPPGQPCPCILSLRLVGPQTGAACWIFLYACCATTRRRPLRRCAAAPATAALCCNRRWCVVQPPPLLHCTVAAADAKLWSMVACCNGHRWTAEVWSVHMWWWRCRWCAGMLIAVMKTWYSSCPVFKRPSDFTAERRQPFRHGTPEYRLRACGAKPWGSQEFWLCG